MATDEKYFAARVFPKAYAECDSNGSMLRIMLEKMSRDLADKALTELEKGDRIFRLSSVIENNNIPGMPSEIEYRQYLMITDLVRCKDCKYGMTAHGIASERVLCAKPYAADTIPGAMHDRDWFCADGIRKEENDGSSR